MDVHFISTLTPDDEDRFAPVVIAALKAIVDVMPISYTVRIETANAKVFQHSNAGPVKGDSRGSGANGRIADSQIRRAPANEPARP